MIENTPWGAPQSVDWLRDAAGEETGLAFVSTASHGGYYVPQQLLEHVPQAWRDASWNGNGKAGWFEEDCDWAMVALVFPQAFIAREREIARKVAAQWLEPRLYRGAFEGY